METHYNLNSQSSSNEENIHEPIHKSIKFQLYEKIKHRNMDLERNKQIICLQELIKKGVSTREIMKLGFNRRRINRWQEKYKKNLFDYRLKKKEKLNRN